MNFLSQPYHSLTRHAASNGRPLWPSPDFGDEYRNTIFPTGGGTVSYESSTWRTGNSKTFPSGPCLPFLPSHSVCRTLLAHWLNFTTEYVAPLLITLKTAAIHPTSSILSPPQKASPPVTRICLLPPPWPSRSQAAAAQPPPWLSCSSPSGTMVAVTIVVTLTPPGLIIGKATDQAIGWTATLTAEAATRATLTPLGSTPGRATGLTVKAKEAAQAFTILRWTMARSLKAVVAAAQTAKDRHFRAFQEELGLSLDNNGEELAPSTP
jgi:hypothetical protein